ncbi:hypothetical protein [Aestuariivivens insulae]|uniref:hypothetical protein n=1 Tax=Aestuariivivens insulae TaxID=1621988 RepID=UPI001F5AA62B|nr:hypothetical protein [Aestuariivivens insulae]
MNYKKISGYVVLGILFFLPVTFLLFLYPATHNYTPLEIVNENVVELSSLDELKLEGHITVLAFFGKKPLNKVISASNLKELVYDKFKGFKKFQIIAVSPKSSKQEYVELDKEIKRYEELRFWHYAYSSEEDILKLYNSLKHKQPLDGDLSTDAVFIIDKDRSQRGRLDDRSDKEIEKDKPIYGLYSYNCVEVDEIKNKMNDDLRILFTEYRQKRKGNFNTDTRRANDLKEKAD